MTIDWFIVLTPLVLLPVVLLFAFVGCGPQDYGEAPSTVEQTVIFQWTSLEPNLDHIDLQCTVTDSKGGFKSDSPVATATENWLTQPGSYSLTVKVKNSATETFSGTATCTVVGKDGHTHTAASAAPKNFMLDGPWHFYLGYVVDVDWSTGKVTGHHYSLG